MRATSWIARVTLDQSAQAVEVVGEGARLELRPLVDLLGRPFARRREHLLDAFLLDHDRAVCVEHDHVALPDRRPADLDRLADRPRHLLVGAAHAHPVRPDRQPELAQLLGVANGGVDEERGDPAALRLGGEQVADERDRPRLRHRQHQHLAGLGLRDGGVDHQVVVLAAADGAGRARGPRAGDHLDQVEVDHLRPSGRLVHGRRAELGQLCVEAHRASTTCGVTRWKASANSTALFPDERRAWLPRRAASSS